MNKPFVSIVNYQNRSSVKRVIDLCEGFNSLKPYSHVLLKPNICTAQAGFFPPFGTVTTTAVIEGVVMALKDFGVSDISIGEGTVLDELGTNTRQGFRWIHLHRLAKRYGVKLVDFNTGPHKRVSSGGITMNIAEKALDTDFFINLPVLKTHIAARISLSSKNLKGCLSMKSRKFFHGKEGRLHHNISKLMEVIPQHLVIIDGLYVMDNGPDATTGTAHPRGVIVASQDFLAADIVGSRMLGAEPEEVPHLSIYAERNGKKEMLREPGAIDIRGDRDAYRIEFVPWDAVTGEDLKSRGHREIEIREIRNTVCSGCYANLTGPTLLLSALAENKKFNNLRVIVGKSLRDNVDSSRTFLFGDCAIAENRHLKQATRIPGCPPNFFKSCFILANQMEGIWGRIFFYTRLLLYFVKAGMGIGMLPLPRYSIYKNNPDYNLKHYRIT